ncbi:MAG: ArsB/NhaD family transporter [Chloroflexi bacterium]|nr:ArsB/NhaD family transporter [Chloroflexota bacterium]
MNTTWLAGAIFLFTYAIIVSERLHRTTAALMGGLLMILAGILTQEEAFHAVDLNVIFLLTGMMVIAHFMSETGVFQWMAVQAVRLGRWDPLRVMILVALITALASSLLDNVTVVVLMAPVTLFVATTLDVSPIPFLITQVMASNIGGAATLIGDPPNILVASRANIDFVTFLVNMGPPTLLILLAYVGIMAVQFQKELRISPEHRKRPVHLETRELITNPTLLAQTLVVLGLVLIGFLLHGLLHLEPATIALSGATLLLIWTRKDPHHVLQHVEWSTLMFFVGLFIAVEGVVAVGLVEQAAHALLKLTAGDVRVTTLFILWFSALASGIVDNIPYVTTMLPIVETLGTVMPDRPLWWALALGADMGGNLTLVGASANVVVASIAERSGHKLTFGMFLRYGVMTVFISLLIGTLWIWLMYL